MSPYIIARLILHSVCSIIMAVKLALGLRDVAQSSLGKLGFVTGAKGWTFELFSSIAVCVNKHLPGHITTKR